MARLMFTCGIRSYDVFTYFTGAKPFGGADNIDGQLHGDKECSFSGVTNSGRVWRKVVESKAWSVFVRMTV